jgi:hypothetical protein
VGLDSDEPHPQDIWINIDARINMKGASPPWTPS